VAYPTPPAARKHPTLRLHLPVQQGPGGRQGDGADVDQGHAQPAAWVLLHRLNWVLRGWTTYFRHGASSATFDYLRAFTWRRVVTWLRRKHPRISWKELRRRYLPGWWPTQGTVTMANPAAVAIVRYRYRGARIPTPWTSSSGGSTR
jgi:hypothetical protein